MSALTTIYFLIMVCGEPQSILEYDPKTQVTTTYSRSELDEPEVRHYLYNELKKRKGTNVFRISETGECI